MLDSSRWHEPSGNACLRRNAKQRLDSEFTIFNLVIRLIKVNELAFFSIFTLSTVDVLNTCLLYQGLTFLMESSCIVGSRVNNFLSLPLMQVTDGQYK